MSHGSARQLISLQGFINVGHLFPKPSKILRDTLWLFTKQGNGYLYNESQGEINSRDSNVVCSLLGKFYLFPPRRYADTPGAFIFSLFLDANHQLHWGFGIDASSAWDQFVFYYQETPVMSPSLVLVAVVTWSPPTWPVQSPSLARVV